MMLLFPLFLGGCGDAEADQARETPRQVAPAGAARVEVAVVEQTELTVDISLPGEVEAARDAMLASALGGFVEKVYVHGGQTVSKGQLLARIDSELYSAQLDQAEARLAQAEDDLARQEKLGDLGAEARLRALKTQVELAEADVRQARVRASRSKIYAPFSGTIAGVGIERGEVTGPGAPAIRVVQTDPAKITLAVPDRDVVALSVGMPVDVRVPARGQVFAGTIGAIAPAADLRTRAFEVAVGVANPDGQLLPGMVARVDVHGTLDQDVVVLPQDWIVPRGQTHGVYVDRDGSAVFQEVTLGQVVHERIVVTSGVAVGDRVVVTGHRDLLDGDALLVERTGVCCTDGRPVFDKASQ